MNWKEKTTDWVENGKRIRVNVIGCTCCACRYSDLIPEEKMGIRDSDLIFNCWKHDKRVSAWKEPCEDFK